MKVRLKKLGEQFLGNKSTSVLFVLIFLMIVFTFASPAQSFISYPSLRVIASVLPTIGIMTLGMVVLMICGEFDLSCGSIYAFSGTVLAITYTQFGVNSIGAMAFALLIGTFLGFVNGFIVTKAKINSFIVTLGTMWSFRGLIYLITSGYNVGYFPPGVIGGSIAGNVLGIPVQFLWLIAIAILLSIMLERTRFGNWIFATGSNKEAARMMGINTDRVKIICFCLMGFLAGVSSIVETTRISIGIPSAGSAISLEVIAGSIVGGTYLRGGQGSVIAGLFGAMIISVLSSGLIMTGFSEFHFLVAVGAVLILGVVANTAIKRRGMKRHSS